MNDSAGALGGLILTVVGFAVAFVIFLAMREVWCWYWKINAAMVELKALRATLEQTNKLLATRTTQPEGDGWSKIP